MQVSSPRFKSLAVTAGLSFWFFIITSGIGVFTLELLVIFIVSVLVVTQIFAPKISKGLDVFAIINTKIFLGALFVFVISIYGILFRFLRIDLLRLKKQKESYWSEMDSASNNLRKQY
jgi:glycosyltransferase involved in cell wall biosynthesis|tara:strand:+ start:130 stop:483 length:354 start_codon:yes stop_codon:yes gene_type:complete